MTFLHWTFDPAVIQAFLPSPFEVDVRDDRAWVSMTLFVMSGFRLGPLPGVPGMSTFPETNLRTYVRGPDGHDGIWFFSLEAASLPLVVGASMLYGVPYKWADMDVTTTGDTVRYRSHRRHDPSVGHDVSVRIGEHRPEESPIDDWLTGRWRAYTTVRGRPAAVPVDHPPWPMADVTVLDLDESLFRAAGLPAVGPPIHARYSPGVDVRLGLIRRV
jgi:hypothetical protein